MLPDEKELIDIKLDVGLLKRDVEQSNHLCQKLSESIEKMQEINVNIVKMISLHEQRHEQHEKTETGMKEDIKELHSRITTVNREIHDRMDEIEHHISSRIDALRTDLIQHKSQDKNKLGDKIAEIENWKFFVMGAIAFGGWLMGHLDILGKVFK